jgi:nucleotide-binding universal stress UspA family protein
MSRFPPKKILVAYDMSDVSRAAWRHASALAASCRAALDVVYVEPWEMGADLMPPPGPMSWRIAELRKKIARAVGAKARVAILQGDPARRILSYARLHRSDLIVVGTHGRSGLQRVMLGSVAEEIIRASPVPVLAARGPVRPVRAILAPVNFTDYAEYGLGYAAGAALAMKAELTALHVTDDPVWAGNPHFRLGDAFKRLPMEVRRNCRLEVEVSVGEVSEGILSARKGHDWIVLVAHEKSRIKDAFFGTTLERVLRISPVPVLSVPFPRRDTPAKEEHGHHRLPVGRA